VEFTTVGTHNHPRFWFDNLVLGLASALTGVLGYAFYSMLAHHLGASHYGTATSLFNLLALLMTPAPMVTLYYLRTGDRVNRQSGRALLAIGTTLFLGISALSRVLGPSFHISSHLLVLYGLALMPQFWLAANLGRLDRQRRFLAIGALSVANQAAQDLSVWAASTIWPKHTLDALALFEWGVVWLSLGASQKLLGRPWPTPMVSTPPSFFLVVGVAVTGALAQGFITVDGLMAKIELPAVAAGQLNGLATIVHTLPDLAGSLGTVMVTSILAQARTHHAYFGRSIGLYLGLGGLGLILFASAPHMVVLTFLGPAFVPESGQLLPYAIAMLAVGLIYLLALDAVANDHALVIVTVALGFAAWVGVLSHQHSVPGFIHATEWTMLGTVGALLPARVIKPSALVRSQAALADPQTVRRKAPDKGPLEPIIPNDDPEPPPGHDRPPKSGPPPKS
jgi:hypothetical protein